MDLNFTFVKNYQILIICIRYYSEHPMSVKRAVFSSMFLKAIRLISLKFYDKEMDMIMEIGMKLQYPKNFLGNCYGRPRKSFYLSFDKPKTSKCILKLLYKENFLSSLIVEVFNVKIIFTLTMPL